ncbi:NCS2 family permease [Spiroplasma endosymbiont of Othius punctulatus]|uniref:NCS2 family permease n=1 Tax=Spiroplasma endosymbiont of Othius punctulatus TaxID=3066289 RepID=UPI0030CA8180
MLIKKIDSYFRLNDMKTTIRQEFIGGLVSFVSILYILSVNPTMLGTAPSINGDEILMSSGGVFIATAITIIVSTLILGLFANVPIVAAPGMGLNAMFAFSLARSGIGYEGALVACMIGSILFFALSITPARLAIIYAMPEQLHMAISVAVGFFIAYVGLTSMHVFEAPTGIPVAELSNFGDMWLTLLLSFSTLFLILFFHIKNIKGGIIFALLIMMVPTLILANIPGLQENNIIVEGGLDAAKWKGWSYDDFSGFSMNIENTWKQISNTEIWTSPTFYLSILTMLFLSFFDSTGTQLVAVSKLSEELETEIKISKKQVISDSLGSVIGSATGTSPTTAFLESTIGISSGARTGLSAVFTAGMFALAIPLFPIFQMIPTALTGAASVYVGTLMISNIGKINWKNYAISTMTFIMILLMVTTFSITNGIGFGVIFYVILEVMYKRAKEIKPMLWVLAIAFAIYFIALIWN